MKIKVEVKFHDEDEWGIMLESYTEKTTFPPPLTVNERDMIAATAFEPNGISIWFKKPSPRSHPTHCERKRKYSFRSVHT